MTTISNNLALLFVLLFSPAGLAVALLVIGLIFFWKLTITIIALAAIFWDS